MEALGGFAIAGALIYGGFRVIETGATPGSSSPSSPPSCSPMSREAAGAPQHRAQFGLVGVRILFEIIDSPPTEPNDDDKPALNITEARVEFNDVRFGYRPARIVIRGMTFGAEPGKMTALVGPSGGGKSTVFNLILRFYDTDAGSIEIDGQDIRRRIAPLASRPGRLCRPGRVPVPRHGPREHRHRQARRERGRDRRRAKAAHAPRVRQRVPGRIRHTPWASAARSSPRRTPAHRHCAALVKDAQIILLDEATASLDSESERQVQDAMTICARAAPRSPSPTRLHTITHADRIW